MNHSESNNRPAVVALVSNIPTELTLLRQWVAYRLEPRAGETKLTKTPYRAPGVRAKTNDLSTWLTYETACALALQDGFAGIGFVFSRDDPYTGIDLDKCRNPENGQVDESAQGIIEQLDSYIEASQSGTGVHIILRGGLPQGHGARRRPGGI